MKTVAAGAVAFALVLAAALPAQDPEKPPAAARVGVVSIRDCMEKGRNAWVADIELELQKIVEQDSGRSTDPNPQERARVRAKVQEAGNRRRLEVYGEIVRVSGLIARERGLEIVQNSDRMPGLPTPEADLMPILERRAVVWHAPETELTQAVLDRLNREYAERKKK